MIPPDPQFETRFARDAADLEAAQHLRYRVFVEELGADGVLVDHVAQLERDDFDPYFEHLLLIDRTRSGAVREQIVGVYRVLSDERAKVAGRFYSEDEFDLTALKTSGRRLLELGRSCLLPDYRGGMAMFHLWNALAAYVVEENIDVLFGAASFFGTDVQALAEPLSLLHHRHLAPAELRVRTQPGHFHSMNLMPEAQIDRRRAMLNVPSLIKAYLRLGGCVGEGAFVDEAFKTIDVCLVMDTQKLSERQRNIYMRGTENGTGRSTLKGPEKAPEEGPQKGPRTGTAAQ
ncbi:hypothetical protein AQS8620_01573 [Aquimixticola soesokkakensis]|uniref:L-ornithine N(alpha)-acyltransferase n=1 Tax=Aquimixticola soesokkakensis TaxID=1519096 RepID=A0A1Y5SHU4_9RHOB|nr:GNAT family N-acyltransferase [Aquimixticola soesokkakensis]SLN41134.1 hypothetical protein AQS8620_01573 [Aquimixticola soesokkakensis]